MHNMYTAIMTRCLKIFRHISCINIAIVSFKHASTSNSTLYLETSIVRVEFNIIAYIALYASDLASCTPRDNNKTTKKHAGRDNNRRSEEHTSELQSQSNLVC